MRDYSQRARELGFDGKWALHPDQLPVINELFSPTPEQFDHACALLDAYERATAEDRRGAVWFDGEMIDEASRKMALVISGKGRAAGMQRTNVWTAPES